MNAIATSTNLQIETVVPAAKRFVIQSKTGDTVSRDTIQFSADRAERYEVAHNAEKKAKAEKRSLKVEQLQAIIDSVRGNRKVLNADYRKACQEFLSVVGLLKSKGSAIPATVSDMVKSLAPAKPAKPAKGEK